MTRPVLLEVMLLGSGSRRLTAVGSGDRELAYYRLLARDFDVCFFEYDALEPAWAAAGFVSAPVAGGGKLAQSTLGAARAARRIPRPSIIRTKQFHGAWAGAILKQRTGAPLVIRMGYHWAHNMLLERRVTNPIARRAVFGFERALLRAADGVIYGSAQLAAAFADLRVPSAVVPNGVDQDTFSPGSGPRAFDAIYVGRLLPIKGFDRLMERLPRGVKTMVIGAGPLQDAVAARPDVAWHARVPNGELPAYLRDARCFVSLSRTEGSPKALFEGVFCGCYPVLSDIGPHRALVEELGYGTLLGDAAGEADLRRAFDGASVPRAALEA
ncbi:MAG TPA: glycosyltransferase family 4 protein, partial [Vicinamibacterales bacterium]|nr:glycosyltransferase family 4 protein [Vicinamibacterales bacterium]